MDKRIEFLPKIANKILGETFAEKLKNQLIEQKRILNRKNKTFNEEEIHESLNNLNYLEK